MKNLTTIIALLFVIAILTVYIIFLQCQLRNINRQLNVRLEEKTRQPLSIQLINPELNKLAANINKCLKAEEILRLESVREEKKFKEIIANISHDLRTPLTVIKGYQQLIENGELTEDQLKKLRVARKSADELETLIQNFFEYSYLVNSDIRMNPERINLTNLVTECLAASVTAFEEHGLSVMVEEAPPVYIYADEAMVTRIVQNLIRNCAAHSAGSIKVSISAADKALLFFENPVSNPEGIDVTRIFDRFYTGDQARSNVSTGLGLSIVKLLTEQIGGDVHAKLKNGNLIIRIELPMFKIKAN